MKTTVDLVIRNASELITCSGPTSGVCGEHLDQLTSIVDGAIAITNGVIVAVGSTSDIMSKYIGREEVDASGHLVSPTLVDSHTHLIHSGTRESELNARALDLQGKGISTGGIRETISKTGAASDEELLSLAERSLNKMLVHGTGLVEAKTGYGADMAAEMRCLSLAKKLDTNHVMEVVPTFLGAHIPPTEGREAFLDSVVAAIPEAAKLAEFCDVACDPMCFTFDECDRIAEVADAHGMRLRVHANQTGPWRGLELAAKWKAASADHGDFASTDEIDALARNGVVLTLLPGANFHMLETVSSVQGDELIPSPKEHLPLIGARIKASNCVPAVATNFNPGSSPCLSMQMMMQLLPRMFRFGFSAVWYMATLNAAVSLGRAHRTGSLEVGKEANVILWNVKNHGQVIDQFGVNHVRDVWLKGHKVVSSTNLIK